MIKVLLQTFVKENGVGRSVYPNFPHSEKQAFDMETPEGFECVVVHRVSKDTVNVVLIQKEYPEEVIFI